MERELPRPKRWPEVIWAIWEGEIEYRLLWCSTWLSSTTIILWDDYKLVFYNEKSLGSSGKPEHRFFCEMIKWRYLIPTVLEELLLDLEESLRCQQGVRASLQYKNNIATWNSYSNNSNSQNKCISPDTREVIDDFEIMRTHFIIRCVNVRSNIRLDAVISTSQGLLLQSAPNGSRTNHLTFTRLALTTRPRWQLACERSKHMWAWTVWLVRAYCLVIMKSDLMSLSYSLHIQLIGDFL